MKICDKHDYYSNVWEGIAGCPYCSLENEIKFIISDIRFHAEDIILFITKLHQLRYENVNNTKATEIIEKLINKYDIEQLANILKKFLE